MTPDFINGHIKFETEWLRLYFVLFLTDVSGSIALLGKTQPMNSMMDIILVILGFVAACVFALLMYKKGKKIRNLLNHLNS